MNNNEKLAIIAKLEAIRTMHPELTKEEKAALLIAATAVADQGKPAWIPCGDQMPKNNDEDRVVITSGGNTAIVTNYNNGFNCTSFDRKHEIKGVKAWFYLPENFGEYEGEEE